MRHRRGSRAGPAGAGSVAQAPDLARLSSSASPGRVRGPSPGRGFAHCCAHRATGGPGGLQKPWPLPWQTTSSCFLATPCGPLGQAWGGLSPRPQPRSICPQAAGAVGAGPGRPGPGCRPLTCHDLPRRLASPSTTTGLLQAQLLPAAHSFPGLQSWAPLGTWSELGPGHSPTLGSGGVLASLTSSGGLQYSPYTCLAPPTPTRGLGYNPPIPLED